MRSFGDGEIISPSSTVLVNLTGFDPSAAKGAETHCAATASSSAMITHSSLILLPRQRRKCLAFERNFLSAVSRPRDSDEPSLVSLWPNTKLDGGLIISWSRVAFAASASVGSASL